MKKQTKQLGLRSLGDSKAEWSGFETFERPPLCTIVTCISSEITAVCPVTGHPDFYTVTILYRPIERCIESKTLKLYLQSFRTKGIFCEAFAHQIAEDVMAAAQAALVDVEVKQVPRGGVGITAKARKFLDENF